MPVLRVTRMTSVVTTPTEDPNVRLVELDTAGAAYTIDQVLQYLTSKEFEESKRQLRNAKVVVREA